MYFNERECLKAMFDADIRTWKDLTKKSGVPARTLYNVRIGETVPTIDQCYAIADALKLDDYRFFRVFPRKDR